MPSSIVSGRPSSLPTLGSCLLHKVDESSPQQTRLCILLHRLVAFPLVELVNLTTSDDWPCEFANFAQFHSVPLPHHVVARKLVVLDVSYVHRCAKKFAEFLPAKPGAFQQIYSYICKVISNWCVNRSQTPTPNQPNIPHPPDLLIRVSFSNPALSHWTTTISFLSAPYAIENMAFRSYIASASQRFRAIAIQHLHPITFPTNSLNKYPRPAVRRRLDGIESRSRQVLVAEASTVPSFKFMRVT